MCAIVGIYGNDNAARLASIALFAMQHRGQEATGISSSCDGKIYTKKVEVWFLKYLMKKH